MMMIKKLMTWATKSIPFLLLLMLAPAITRAAYTNLPPDSLTISGSTGYLSAISQDSTHTSNYTVTAADMGGIVNMNVSGGGTLTIPTINTASFTASMSGTTMTTTGTPTGTIAIGQLVYGPYVAPGTLITAGSGSSWTINKSQSVNSELMTSASPFQPGASLWLSNFSASALTISSTPTINNCTGTVASGAAWLLTGNSGGTIDCTAIGSGAGGGVTGSGTTNTVAKFTGSTAIGNSKTTDNGNTTAIAEGALTTPVALTDGSTIAVNLFNSNNFTLTLSGTGHTISNPTNATVGQHVDFLITQPASGGPDTISFGTDYLNSAGNQFSVALNTAASAVTEVPCTVIATTPTLICYGPAVAPAFTSSNVSGTVTAPASTTAFTMMGLAGAFTPGVTGNMKLTVSGSIISQGATTATIGIQYKICYGTGTAPTNGAAATGTCIGLVQSHENGTTLTAANDGIWPFSISYGVTGLTIGTAYWYDLQAEAITTASDNALSNVMLVATEIH